MRGTPTPSAPPGAGIRSRRYTVRGPLSRWRTCRGEDGRSTGPGALCAARTSTLAPTGAAA